MKLKKKRPKDGQFVMVWIYDERIWCKTFKWKDGSIYRFGLNDGSGYWIPHIVDEERDIKILGYLRKTKILN